MALNYYSNWAAAFQSTDITSDSFPPPEPHQFTNADWNVDSVFKTDDVIYSENCSSLHYDYLSAGVTPIYPENCSSLHCDYLSAGITPIYDNINYSDNFFNFHKRHKGFEYEEMYPQFKPGYYDGIVPNPNFQAPEIIEVPPLPDFPSYCEGTVTKEPTAGASGSLSAQSIAARQRRRKITEKTQELGKLVPGGQKMNTAEMLQAAYKYIKFLRGQVGILEFMNSYSQEEDEQFESDEELHDLLESPLIQEKLYSNEKCLVPQKFMEELSTDHKILKSNPTLVSLTMKQEH